LLRPHAGLRRLRTSMGKLLMAAAAAGTAALMAGQSLSVQESMAFAFAGAAPGGLQVPDRRAASSDLIAREAVKTVLRPWRGTSRFKSYDGFIFKRKKLPGIRLRLDRFGTGKRPFYRIKAAFQPRKQHRSGRFLESLGWWDPMREVSDPRFMKIKADRMVFWLRSGAQPTDMVASLLDRIGIIRRTGPLSKLGEWEWRIPPTSGPEAPEGWSYDGPHEVTWGNKPMINHRKGQTARKNIDKVPLVERYGFKGYQKIPIEGDVLTEPLTRSSLMESFSNTDLPI